MKTTVRSLDFRDQKFKVVYSLVEDAKRQFEAGFEVAIISSQTIIGIEKEISRIFKNEASIEYYHTRRFEIERERVTKLETLMKMPLEEIFTKCSIK